MQHVNSHHQCAGPQVASCGPRDDINAGTQHAALFGGSSSLQQPGIPAGNPNLGGARSLPTGPHALYALGQTNGLGLRAGSLALPGLRGSGPGPVGQGWLGECLRTLLAAY
jgi:hypothetical protein